ncbi:Sir2 family NAD-dependent protein deacetylase [Corynebacterium bovis]|uniref:Sir2 family NAD-dependent protein deacetylase n=1 Tax=Corynebacterium bovis TaxID=36808 RepID=UPI00244B3457|nr:Sir2 family NAD-dependent protein deacetylase [Corynebacterium bovis]MDH2454953.1 Sir2 family NAD-dependent protein deacetylase [Corynebacterium bovis]
MSRPDPVALAHRSALRSIARVVVETRTPTPPAVAARRVASQLLDGDVLVLTGAGVSTDSGIPDYRGPSGSLTRHRPMTYQEFRHDPAASHRYWARSFVGWRHMDTAVPNDTHHALAELESVGAVSGIVTQNVDGLHAAAGSRNVLALHGDLATVVCLRCGAREDRRSLDGRLRAANPGYLESVRLDPAQVNPDGDVSLSDDVVARFRMPGCAECGSGLLKPDVVYFGEPVPGERRERVAHMLGEARSVLVAGSSLAVMSGFRIVLDALKAGLPVAVVNGGPGRADDRVDVVWRTPVRPAFHHLIDAVCP